MIEVLLTPQEVAEQLKISESQAYKLIRRNEMISVRFGRNVRVRPEDLKKFIEEHLS